MARLGRSEPVVNSEKPKTTLTPPAPKKVRDKQFGVSMANSSAMR